MVIKPIKTKRDYENALRRIGHLMDAKSNTPEGDELDILATLVEAYDKKCYPVLPPDPVEAIKFRMEQLGLSRADLAPYLGGRNRVSEVLNRRRSLSIKMIRELHKKLNIPAESLLG
jgi:HTH-type transcriptional regulator/antitoxin HigA